MENRFYSAPHPARTYKFNGITRRRIRGAAELKNHGHISKPRFGGPRLNNEQTRGKFQRPGPAHQQRTNPDSSFPPPSPSPSPSPPRIRAFARPRPWIPACLRLPLPLPRRPRPSCAGGARQATIPRPTRASPAGSTLPSSSAAATTTRRGTSPTLLCPALPYPTLHPARL